MLFRHFKLIFVVLFLIVNSLQVLALASTDKTDEQRSFLRAEKIIASSNWAELPQLEQKLKNYPLLSYLQQQKLLTSLNTRNINAIEDFLETHGNQPVARKLRYKWLHWLAKNNYTSLFLRHYRDFNSTQLSCKQLEYRLKTAENKKDIYRKTEKIWLSGRNLPAYCNSLISQWKKSNLFSSQLVWQRILIALKAPNRNLARKLIRQLPAHEQEAGKLLININQHPEKLANINFRKPLTSKAVDIIMTGLNKLAWKNPDKTISLWQSLGSKYKLEGDFSKIKRAVSLSLAIEKDPRAESWLSSLSNANDSSVNQWLLTTALQNKNWTKISNLAGHFADNKKDANKWHYWRGVAETQLGNLTKAQSIFQTLANKRSYYGFLASRQLNQPASLHQKTIEFPEQELKKLENSASAMRAREFFVLGRLTSARREWNHLVKNTARQSQVKLALIAHRWGWQHQAILAFARSKQINDVDKRFPRQHFNLYAEQAKNHNIPLSWAYAITRQESAFKTDAISSAGARGLMQLKHSTAKGVAKNKPLKASHLLLPDTNIKLGTAHLQKVFESFNKNPVLATAAYNAGKRRVQQWLNNSQSTNAIEWIEQIPYKETRDYVKNVFTYQLIYAKLTHQNDNFIAQLDNLPIKID